MVLLQLIVGTKKLVRIFKALGSMFIRDRLVQIATALFVIVVVGLYAARVEIVLGWKPFVNATVSVVDVEGVARIYVYKLSLRSLIFKNPVMEVNLYTSKGSVGKKLVRLNSTYLEDVWIELGRVRGFVDTFIRILDEATGGVCLPSVFSLHIVNYSMPFCSGKIYVDAYYANPKIVVRTNGTTVTPILLFCNVSENIENCYEVKLEPCAANCSYELSGTPWSSYIYTAYEYPCYGGLGVCRYYTNYKTNVLLFSCSLGLSIPPIAAIYGLFLVWRLRKRIYRRG